MAFALYRKQIRCGNCGYEGSARIAGTSGAAWLVWVVLFCISCIVWPLLIITIPWFIWLLLKPAPQVCPRCGWQWPEVVIRPRGPT